MDEQEYNKKYIQAKVQSAAGHMLTGKKDDAHALRLPPGQILTQGFPILDLGVRPKREEYAGWSIEFRGKVKNKKIFTLEEIKKKFPKAERTLDFHCVTRWSRYDIKWGGALLTDIMKEVMPEDSVKYAIFYSYDKYATNIPFKELLTDNVLIAYELDGGDIPPEHGGPVRMIIPTLYGWKSAKFVTAIEFRDEDEPGFWEVRGYHNHGDPWLEERYS